ncbi:hypothetical protein K488DRAFT_75112 [Vararia minispora EC-137]|uniref:Uncharacterized protein n=1 Tax=Vararia minispora EC-137 TaxID=1314806 RepID=A0ACB8Q4P9_9AGAM|nr:hypothetical protein K488DRAFT_75112 [Vararia minispora EC-137]
MSHSLSAPANCSDPDLYFYEKRRMPSVDASCFKRALCFRKDDINRGHWYEQLDSGLNHNRIIADKLFAMLLLERLFASLSSVGSRHVCHLPRFNKYHNGIKNAGLVTTMVGKWLAELVDDQRHAQPQLLIPALVLPARPAHLVLMVASANTVMYSLLRRFFPYELLDSPTPAPKRLRCERSPSIEVIDPPSTVQLPIFSGAACLLAIAVLGMAEHIGSWLPHGINGSQLIWLLRRVGTDVRLSDAFCLDRLAITERRLIVIFCHGATAHLEENDMFRPLAFEGKSQRERPRALNAGWSLTSSAGTVLLRVGEYRQMERKKVARVITSSTSVELSWILHTEVDRTGPTCLCGCPTGSVSGLVSGAGELTSGSTGRGEGSLAKGGRDDDDKGSGLDSWPRVSHWMAVGAGRPSMLTPQRSWSKGPGDRSTYDLKA